MRAEKENIINKQKFIHDEHNPSCPLCEQNLSASRKKFLKSRFTHQEQFLLHQLKRLTMVITHLKAVLIEQHTYLEALKKKDEQQKISIVKLEELCKIEQKSQGIFQELTTQHEMLTTTHANLYKRITYVQQDIQQHNQKEQTVFAENPAHQILVHELNMLQKELDQTTVNQQHYQQLLDQLNIIEEQRIKAHELQQALQAQHDRRQRIHELCITLKKFKTSKKELSHALEGFAGLDEQWKTIMTHETQLQVLLTQLQEEKETLFQQKGSLDNEQLLLSQKEQEHKNQQTRIQELTTVSDDYQIIAHAVSKDGIQALIIEEALPEIEHEANLLLGQLTDNQAHIMIESLRDLKKGGSKETLDIKISDSAGVRPYELFSGGEAFRIDFALRLAISKLLARRAGTSLQTLIIDEGFGSQDEEGLAHIMDALYKIQDNFCKIIIVSHLPAMKDQFPVHFFVEKHSQGSTVRVIEQG